MEKRNSHTHNRRSGNANGNSDSSSSTQRKEKMCSNCRRLLYLGFDGLGVQQGVIGGRGFIPLEEMMIFCSDRCLADFYGNGEPLPARIP